MKIERLIFLLGPLSFQQGAASTKLDEIRGRGWLNCGIVLYPGLAMVPEGGQDAVGMDVDLCQAFAAAIFGSPENLELVTLAFTERLTAVTNGTVDLVGITPPTMGRDANPSMPSDYKSFSFPYFYDSLSFAGDPAYVACADTYNTMNACSGLKVCVIDRTTWSDFVKSKFPADNIVLTDSIISLIGLVIDGTCDVFAGDSVLASESVVRSVGYNGSYAVSTVLHTHDPLVFMTQETDPGWSDFVNWVLQALFFAEEKGISQGLAGSFPTTDLYGPNETDVFINAIAANGNYGEIYAAHMEAVVPRGGLNMLNNGTSGLIYSLPFGTATTTKAPFGSGKLQMIRQRGVLHCGVTKNSLFSSFNASTQAWSGYDVDYCRAIAAAIFGGDSSRVVFTYLQSIDRFMALSVDAVDVLSRVTTHTLSRDVKEPTTGVGMTFTSPTFYDGAAFGGDPVFVACAENQDTTSVDCTNLLVCAGEGTTTIGVVRNLLPEANIVASQGSDVEAFVSGLCNVVASDSSSIPEVTVRGVGYTGNYTVGSVRYSKEPLALVTNQNDPHFSDFVYWVVQAIFYAEENGITQATASNMPEIAIFGPDFLDMFRYAVGAVGNYAEIYERNLGMNIPRGGLNLLNTGGAQIYAFPGF